MATSPVDLWKDFEALTHGGVRPFLYKGILPRAGCGATADDVSKAFFSLRDSDLRDQLDCNVRVYLEESRRDDILTGLLEALASGSEDILEFMNSHTGQKRFSLVLNNLEQASADLAGHFGRFLSSFFSARGVPLGGAEQAAFCGNYAGTAFGIHEGFEHAFLCHLGPGKKDFYCISRNDYLAITGSREPTYSTSTLFTDIIEQSEHFVLETGDALYLPASVYHIGRQSAYSVSVALPLYSYPESRFVAHRVLPTLARTTLPFDEEGMSEYVTDKRSFKNRIKEVFEQSARNWNDSELDRFLTYYWCRLASNGFWELPSRVAHNIYEEERLAPPQVVPVGVKARLRQPFKAVAIDGLDCSDGSARVFLAAKSVVVAMDGDMLANLISTLNREHDLGVDGTELAGAIGELCRTGGIELIS